MTWATRTARSRHDNNLLFYPYHNQREQTKRVIDHMFDYYQLLTGTFSIETPHKYHFLIRFDPLQGGTYEPAVGLTGIWYVEQSDLTYVKVEIWLITHNNFV